ncbi:hypothetical protein BACCAP_02120 [Pseudoflavonifractor capillosus ATCC 29799]|uniref:Uncharacterized protein n=1 Tax=Pseudoflavonifractor capillosus ATCC 29799 TaxID=411467 RepID=A6NV85_9FIRM|nr:hypothetical protein BACCAP_02120 [Pseudoflavonifractor capillosus ATCC 29799]
MRLAELGGALLRLFPPGALFLHFPGENPVKLCGFLLTFPWGEYMIITSERTCPLQTCGVRLFLRFPRY